MPAQYVYGRNTVLSLLEHDAARVQKVFVAEGLKSERRLSEIQQRCKNEGVLQITVPRLKLEQVLQQCEAYLEEEAEGGKGVHQGVVALVSEKPMLELHAWISSLPTPRPMGWVLALDGITDPHNIGAMLRVAEGAGCLGVLLPKHRSGGLSPVVSKTSAGADALLPLVQVTNLGQALDSLKKEGFWLVGTALPSPTLRVQPYHQLAFDMPTVLVMGSEGEGLRPSIQKACDFLVTIPMLGKVQSLNVATATAVLAFHIALQFQTHAKKG